MVSLLLIADICHAGVELSNKFKSHLLFPILMHLYHLGDAYLRDGHCLYDSNISWIF